MITFISHSLPQSPPWWWQPPNQLTSNLALTCIVSQNPDLWTRFIPPPSRHPLDYGVKSTLISRYSQSAVMVTLQASIRPTIKSLNHAVPTWVDKNTPERWKQGLCLSHIGNVASPKVNVEDVHQTSLEQLRDVRSGDQLLGMESRPLSKAQCQNNAWGLY